MVYWFLVPLIEYCNAFNVLRYITIRTICAVLTSLCISFILGPHMIKWLKLKQKNGQPIRIDGPKSHLITKCGTPTMGGFLILSSVFFTTLLWANLSNQYIWIVSFVLGGFGILGGFDDYMKLTKNSSDGLSARVKFLLQLTIGIIACVWTMSLFPDKLCNTISVPFIKDFLLNLGYFFIPFAVIVVVGSSNAVNLTDGLDGLAIVPIMICAGCFCVIAYLVGHIEFAHYLKIEYVPNVGEISIFCGAIIGASLGFLWFNAPPAMVFMGDTGSLSLGGAIGIISVITKHELVLLIIGGLFVMETVSVIMQVLYFRITGGKKNFPYGSYPSSL